MSTTSYRLKLIITLSSMLIISSAFAKKTEDCPLGIPHTFMSILSCTPSEEGSIEDENRLVKLTLTQSIYGCEDKTKVYQASAEYKNALLPGLTGNIITYSPSQIKLETNSDSTLKSLSFYVERDLLLLDLTFTEDGNATGKYKTMDGSEGNFTAVNCKGPAQAE